MGVIQCANGHYYDNSKFEECPHCKDALLPSKPIMNLEWNTPRHKDDKTVGIFSIGKNQTPVVGWVVCVKGKERGRDYRLHAGRNFVGRSLQMDIALVDDERVSRENHCSIIFEPKKRQFLLMNGRGDGVLVNHKKVLDSVELIGEDLIEIGSSQFVFVPFCKEGREWLE